MFAGAREQGEGHVRTGEEIRPCIIFIDEAVGRQRGAASAGATTRGSRPQPAAGGDGRLRDELGRHRGSGRIARRSTWRWRPGRFDRQITLDSDAKGREAIIRIHGTSSRKRHDMKELARRTPGFRRDQNSSTRPPSGRKVQDEEDQHDIADEAIERIVMGPAKGRLTDKEKDLVATTRRARLLAKRFPARSRGEGLQSEVAPEASRRDT